MHCLCKQEGECKVYLASYKENESEREREGGRKGGRERERGREGLERGSVFVDSQCSLCVGGFTG